MSNRVAFVTGGAQGIGQGISETLGASGFRVAVADLNLEAAQATAKRIADAGGEAIAVQVDVTDTESVRSAVKTATAELGDIEIVVNNAGWDDFMPFLKTSEDFWDKILDINFKGALRVSHIVVPGMVERGFGRVINIGSDAGRVGLVARGGLFRGEGRHHRVHQDAGPRSGDQWGDGQHRLPRPDRHPGAAQVRRQLRSGRRKGDRRDDSRGADETARPSRRTSQPRSPSSHRMPPNTSPVRRCRSAVA